MCDQPSLYYALYLLVQIFAKYDNVPLDLYGLIEGEIRKLYYNKEKKACIEGLKVHMVDAMELYNNKKKYRKDTWGYIGLLSYIMPMRLSLNNSLGDCLVPGRLKDIIVDSTYYINGHKIVPFCDAQNLQFGQNNFGFDIQSKHDYVMLLDDDDTKRYFNSCDDGYSISPHGDNSILKNVIRNQMIWEEYKIRMK
jgi:hypothetical protein